jgi:ATP citrate (pro-S)-lyase
LYFIDLDFSFLEMNPFTLVNGEPYPLDMRGELDDTAAFKNFKKYVYIHTLISGNLQLT